MMERTASSNRTLHDSDGKPGVDQIPPAFLIELGRVYTFGARKYARDNWKLGTYWHEFYGSALRHLLAWWSGEDDDPESGINHLIHAAWNCAALFYYQKEGRGTDDRPKEG